MGYYNDNRFEQTLRFVYKERVVKKGIFFYFDYSITIEISFNFI